VSTKRCYGHPGPGVDLSRLEGWLIVIEGRDSTGRSTHIRRLAEWIEQRGHAVVEVGLHRSPLVGPELEQAKQGNLLSARTMSLFYATDFYDQMENGIIPAMRSGAVVLADRYIFTLMARDLVRGADPDSVESLYAMAIVPDIVFYLSVSMPVLVERTLQAHPRLDYWESGMDLGFSRDWFDSFLIYQRRMEQQFQPLAKKYGFETINANRSLAAIQRDLRDRIASLFERAPE
jgi:dTMP kinase